MIDYDDQIHDLRELEADDDDSGDALTIDEIDVNTGQVKSKPTDLPEVEEPSEPEETEDEYEEEFDDLDEEMPSDDEIMAMEQGFEGSEE